VDPTSKAAIWRTLDTLTDPAGPDQAPNPIAGFALAAVDVEAFTAFLEAGLGMRRDQRPRFVVWLDTKGGVRYDPPPWQQLDRYPTPPLSEVMRETLRDEAQRRGFRILVDREVGADDEDPIRERRDLELVP
jgi:hypothetical protein